MDFLPEALYAAAAIREADRRAAAHHGLGDGVLMERAGAAAFRTLRERFPRARRLAVVCGPGNNGGDGYVVARLARELGWPVAAMSIGEPEQLRGDAAAAYRAWLDSGGTVAAVDARALAECELIVDALFGTGLERPLDGAARAAVTAINGAGRPVVALDLPSGLHADSGRVLGSAVRASITVTFIGLKAGLFTAAGREQAGTLFFEDLGVPPAVFTGLAVRARRITAASLGRLLALRARNAHKGEAGRVLIIGGRPGMPGAVRLAGEAAYRAGAGLVTLATHSSHAPLVSAACPELISVEADHASLPALIGHARATAIGPGLGQDRWAQELWAAASAAGGPLVVDADALRLLASGPQSRPDWVLTPHPGEAAALLGCTVAEVEADRFAAVQRLQERYGGVCVLKGSGTLVAAAGLPVPWLCDRGTPALATGGSGDVLTGAITGLLAQGLRAVDAARLGAWAHARAGELAAADRDRGLLASDLLAPLAAQIAGLVRRADHTAHP